MSFMPSCNYIIGLDLSLTSSGIAKIHRYGSEYDCRAIKTRPKDCDLDRFKLITEPILSIAGLNDLVVIEGYSFNSKGNNLTRLAELVGIVKYTLHSEGIKNLLVIAPRTLKRFVTGNGDAKKELMLLSTYKRWGVSFESSDECDAYCLARIGHCVLSGVTSSKYEHTLLNKLRIRLDV